MTNIFFRIEFWPIFILFLFLYYCFPKKQNWLLFLASIGFLLSFSMYNILSFILIVFIGIALGQKIQTTSKKENRVISAGLGIFLILCILLLSKLLGLKSGLMSLSHSFVSFMMIGYILDSLWKRVKSKQNMLGLINAATFFPIASMGPIEKISAFNKQFQTTKEFDLIILKSGLFNITLGFVKILNVSNLLEKFILHSSAESQKTYGLGLILYCLISFLKIYCEFSGFIDIVNGTGSLLGFKLTQNFNRPYLAKNFTDIWMRWHISLTLWLKEYIFLPLLLKTKNIFLSGLVVILIVGLWHSFYFSYLFWTFYWILIFIFFYSFKTINHKLFRNKLKFHLLLNWSLTQIAIILSTLAFMVEDHGLFQLVNRLFKLTPSSAYSITESFSISSFNFLGLCSSVLVLLLAESLSAKIENSKVYLFIALHIFLIGLFGHFSATEFYYLRF